MDTSSQSGGPQIVQCQCRHCRRGGWGIIGGFFRLIGFLVVLIVVFIVGLAIGGFGPAGAWPFGHGMFWQSTDSEVPRMMLKAGVGQFNLRFGGDDRHFGVVTAVSGQKITIADNGGGTQTVTVTAETVVMDGEKEVPVWTVRRGHSLRVFGSAKEAGISAKLIEIIR